MPLKKHHTLEPWKIEGKSGKPGEAYSITARHRQVARTTNTWSEGAGKEIITNEDRANAHLIKEAPKLLKAAEEMLEILKRIDFSSLPINSDRLPWRRWELTIKRAAWQPRIKDKTNNPESKDQGEIKS